MPTFVSALLSLIWASLTWVSLTWAAALLGWSTSVWLTTKHLAAGRAIGTSGCAFLVAGDCNEVWSSGYATLLSLPVSLWGLIFYSLWLLLLAWHHWTQSKVAADVCTTCVLFALASSAWFVYLMVSLRAFCPSCALVHLSNVLLAVGWFGSMAYNSSRIDRKPQRARMRNTAWSWPHWTLHRGVAFAGIVIGTFYFVHSPDTSYVGTEIERQGKRSEKNLEVVPGREAITAISASLHASDSAISKTSDEPDAIAIPLFLGSDSGQQASLFVCFTCEKCARISRMLEDIIEQFPGRLSIRVHLLPIESECNSAVLTQKPEHIGACQLARLGYAVAYRSPQEYQAFHFAIANKNGTVRFDEARLLAERVLGQPIHQEAVQSPVIEQRVQQDIDLAIDLGINSLPAIVMNGRKYEGCPEHKSTLLEILLP